MLHISQWECSDGKKLIQPYNYKSLQPDEGDGGQEAMIQCYEDRYKHKGRHKQHLIAVWMEMEVGKGKSSDE